MKTVRKEKTFTDVVNIICAAALFCSMIMSQEAVVMTATGWPKFKQSMTEFFYTGLGGDGAQGIGIVIAVVGVLVAAISFVVHKFNPQSRMPGWITCLVVAVIGTLLFAGVAPVIEIIKKIRDIVLGWFGFGGFGNFS